MSRLLGDVDSRVAAAAVRGLTELPENIGLTSLRSLAWPMAQLVAGGARLNLMSLEALAAAQHLEAEICLAVADENPQLCDVARHRSVPLRLIAS